MKDVAAIVAGQRLAFAHRVGSEIGRRQQTAVQLRCRLDRPRNLSFVKNVGPVLGDGCQRTPQIFLNQAIPGLQWRPILAQENACRLRILPDPLDRRIEDVGIAAIEHKPFAGQPDRWRHNLSAIEFAVFAQRRIEAQHRPRHADGPITVQARILDNVAARIEVHVGRRRRRRLFAEVEEDVAPIGQVNRHEPAATNIPATRIDDRLRITNRHRGIDGIAAHLEDVHTDFRGQMLGGHHHPVFFFNGRQRGRERRAGNHRQRQCGQLPPQHTNLHLTPPVNEHSRKSTPPAAPPSLP